MKIPKGVIILVFAGLSLFSYYEYKQISKAKVEYSTNLVIDTKNIDINNIINITVTCFVTLSSSVGATLYWIHDRVDKAEKSLILLSTVNSVIEKDLNETKVDLKANSTELALNIKEIHQNLNLIRENLIKDSFELENLKESVNYVKAFLVKNS